MDEAMVPAGCGGVLVVFPSPPQGSLHKNSVKTRCKISGWRYFFDLFSFLEFLLPLDSSLFDRKPSLLQNIYEVF